jgi:hypothetical protein
MPIIESHLEIYRALNRREANYLVIGGIAVGLHGIPRVTMDIDILIEPTLDNCRKALQALDEAGLKMAGDVAPEVVLETTMYSFMGDVNVDILCGARASDFNDMWKNRTVKQVRDVKIDIISIEDLIETKRHLDRPKDKEDIEMLEKIQRGEL